MHAEISVPRPYAERLCSKTCLVDLLIRSIIRSFPAKNQTNKQTNRTCFALNTNRLSIWVTTSWKMLINNKFKAQTLTGNPTGNYRCQLLASRALYMSYQIAKFMGPTWGPSGADRTQMGPIFASWTLLSGMQLEPISALDRMQVRG